MCCGGGVHQQRGERHPALSSPFFTPSPTLLVWTVIRRTLRMYVRYLPEGVKWAHSAERCHQCRTASIRSG